MITHVSPVPESACPTCGVELGYVSSLENYTPDPGSISIRIDCGAVLAFADDLSLRSATKEEIAKVARQSNFRIMRKAVLMAIQQRCSQNAEHN